MRIARGKFFPLHGGWLTRVDSRIRDPTPYRLGVSNPQVTNLCRGNDAGVSRGPSESRPDIRYLSGSPDSIPVIHSLTTTFSV